MRDFFNTDSMKKIFLFFALLTAMVTAGAQTDESQYRPQLEHGTPAPDITAPDTNGKTVKLSSFKGKYVVVDFWATWCGDCRRDFPEFKQLAADYKGKVTFFGVSFDKSADLWKKFLTDNEVDWVSVCNFKPWKQNPIATAYKLNWIPTMYIIAPDGTIAGGAIHARDIRTQLDALLK